MGKTLVMHKSLLVVHQSFVTDDLKDKNQLAEEWYGHHEYGKRAINTNKVCWSFMAISGGWGPKKRQIKTMSILGIYLGDCLL